MGRWSTLVLGPQRERAGEGSRIDSAARVELRLCFGAVPCCVASLRMRRIFSPPKSSLSRAPLYVTGYVRLPRLCATSAYARDTARRRVYTHVRRKSNESWVYWSGADGGSATARNQNFNSTPVAELGDGGWSLVEGVRDARLFEENNYW